MENYKTVFINVFLSLLVGIFIFVGDYNSFDVDTFKNNDISQSASLSKYIYKYEIEEFHPKCDSQNKLIYCPTFFFRENGVGAVGGYMIKNILFVVFKGTNFFSKEVLRNISSKLVFKVLFIIFVGFFVFKLDGRYRRNYLDRIGLDEGNVWIKTRYEIYKILMCLFFGVIYVIGISMTPDNNRSTAKTIKKINFKSNLFQEIENSKFDRVVFTGHSKGGAEAYFLYGLDKFKDIPKSTISFGGPVPHSEKNQVFSFSTGLDFIQKSIDDKDFAKFEVLGSGWAYLSIYLFIFGHILFIIRQLGIAATTFTVIAFTGLFIWSTHSMTLYDVIINQRLW